ncbi:uncharacterized protein BXZ73DRAFT_108143 [Epithele typhae]|uniref:uncharacterized protein n=1 Tax=Epithele typhae TaxID=378194 RepID=UPI002007E93C|nr:uncharacterized protein BXZ73DRAFT_108143 [Epithele typhae]KAH9911276.1 hypothetical protein BXZ73DRAFT_108143 [Epithele typhae]
MLDVLPTELLLLLLETAWLSTSSPAERLALYRALVASHPIIRALAIHVATRFVIVDLTEMGTGDVSLYTQVTRDAANARPAAEQSLSPSEFSCALFRRSHLHLEGYVFPRSKSLIARTVRWGELENLLRLLSVVVIGDCHSLTVAAPPVADPLHSPLWHHERSPVFTLAQRFRSLERLRLDWSWADRDLPIMDTRPTPLSTVRYLRLREYPPCLCARVVRRGENGAQAGDSPVAVKCLTSCMAGTLPQVFPRLEHLHLDTPVALAAVRAPLTLRTLTLEAPSQAISPSDGGNSHTRSSLLRYDIPALFTVTEVATPTSIITRTTGELPLGWGAALEACIKHGVVLSRRIAY